MFFLLNACVWLGQIVTKRMISIFVYAFLPLWMPAFYGYQKFEEQYFPGPEILTVWGLVLIVFTFMLL